MELADALAVQRVLVGDRVAHEVRHVREPHDLDGRREAQAHRRLMSHKQKRVRRIGNKNL